MNVLVSISIVVGLLMFGILRLGEWFVREQLNRGKKRIIWLDDDSRELGIQLVKTGKKVGNVKLAENEFSVGKGDAGQVFRLDGKAAYAGKFPSWVLHKRYGVNLMGPTDAEFAHKDTYNAVLSMFNPASYYKALSINHAADTIDRNREKKEVPWVALAVIVMLGLVFVVGIVVFAMSKMSGGPA